MSYKLQVEDSRARDARIEKELLRVKKAWWRKEWCRGILETKSFLLGLCTVVLLLTAMAHRMQYGLTYWGAFVVCLVAYIISKVMNDRYRMACARAESKELHAVQQLDDQRQKNMPVQDKLQQAISSLERTDAELRDLGEEMGAVMSRRNKQADEIQRLRVLTGVQPYRADAERPHIRVESSDEVRADEEAEGGGKHEKRMVAK